MQPVKLSVVIITLNEERNIERCIDSVAGVADEIVVVDSFSTDATQAICKAKDVRFLQHTFESYIAQKNVALDAAAYDHVLALDADEALTDELRTSIMAVKQHWTHDGYSFSRLTNYCGTWIKHGGWYPDRKLRLWNRQKGRWTGENPHDYVQLTDGATHAVIPGDLLHYSFYTISDHLKIIDKYTTLQSQGLFERGKRAGLIDLVVRPAFKFFRDYLLKAGFLDGFAGYCVAQLSAKATFVKYAKLRMLRKQSKS